MKTNIKYVPLNSCYTDEATNMIMCSYEKEREAIPYLPECDLQNYLNTSIRDLFNNGCGVAATDGDKLIGFLAGFAIDNFFGNYSGVYCPIYGHGAIGEQYLQIYRGLYKSAADLWVQNTLMAHAITLFSQDENLVNFLFWQGFGLRCVDAIRETSIISTQPKDITVKKSTLEDAEELSEIHTLHNLYYQQSPIFISKKNINAVDEHHDWLSKENHYEWTAYKDNTPVGVIRLAPSAETFVSDHPSVMNIKNVYVLESERGTGIGKQLLNTVQEWLLINNYPLCGVDFESINPLGSSFWMKHFTPYTYSLVRKIDERIL